MPAELGECPKHMVYGPCGGVGLDHSCEVDPRPCVFVDGPTVPWSGVRPASTAPPAQPPDPHALPGPQPGAAAMRELMRRRPVVVVDLPAVPLSAESIRRCAQPLRGLADAVLAGDSGPARLQFPPTYRAHLIQQAGLAVWAGLNCRDRNRVAMEAELAGLADVGVAGVHCVTGDHPLSGSRPDAAPVFDLDSSQAAAVARGYGHLVSVAESPCAPPVQRRVERLRQKQAAGAEVCFVNHAGGAGPVGRFVADARAAGVTTAFVACVPVLLDEASAAVLRSFATSPLPPGYAEEILRAPDPRRAGIAAAAALAGEMLAAGADGINLSGGAAPGHELAYAEAVADVAGRIAAQRPDARGTR